MNCKPEDLVDYYGILGCDELSSVSFVHFINYFAASLQVRMVISVHSVRVEKNLLNCAKINGSLWSVKSDAVAFRNDLEVYIQ